MALGSDHPDLSVVCRSFGIVTETDYLTQEHHLSAAQRDQLAYFRFRYITGRNTSVESVIHDLPWMPPWLLHIRVDRLPFNARAQNRLAQIEASTLADVARLGVPGLMRLDGFGSGTLTHLSRVIFEAFSMGSDAAVALSIPEPQKEPPIRAITQPLLPPLPPLPSAPRPKHIMEAVAFMLTLLKKDRQADILRQRMGLDVAPMTLEELGQTYGCTRERIRQIEAKAIASILEQMPVWKQELRINLVHLLGTRNTPLTLNNLADMVPWLAGVDAYPEQFAYLLHHLTRPAQVHLLHIDDQIYVARISQATWDNALQSARLSLSIAAKKKSPPSKPSVRKALDRFIPRHAAELRPLLFAKAAEMACFSTNAAGENILVAVTHNGIQKPIIDILSASDVPLHFSEITRLCSEMGYHQNPLSIKNLLSRYAYVLGRGTFGLEKHIPLSADERAEVIAAAESVLSEYPDRQWHVHELYLVLLDSGMDFGGRLSKYSLNALLKSSSRLLYLKRFVWVCEKSGLQVSDRCFLKDAIVDILRQHGAPLHRDEIRAYILQERGLNQFFQIRQEDPLIRVAENVWGLLDRDVPFNDAQIQSILDELVATLREKNAGIHSSEFAQALPINRTLIESVDPILVVALALRAQCVKMSLSGYAYLPEWESQRRLSLHEGIRQAIQSFPGGAPASIVAHRASQLIGREVPSQIATNNLTHFARFDHDRSLWIPLFDDDDEDALSEQDTIQDGAI